MLHLYIHFSHILLMQGLKPDANLHRTARRRWRDLFSFTSGLRNALWMHNQKRALLNGIWQKRWNALSCLFQKF